jgi:hypothetical protein
MNPTTRTAALDLAQQLLNPYLPALYITKMDDRSEWLLWDNTQEDSSAAALMRSADAQGGNVRDQQRFAASMVNLKAALSDRAALLAECRRQREEIAALREALQLIADQPREGDIPQQIVRVQRIARAALGAKS